MMRKTQYEMLADTVAEIEQAFLDKALHVSLHKELMAIVETKLSWTLAVDNPAFNSSLFHDRARRLSGNANRVWKKFNETNPVVPALVPSEGANKEDSDDSHPKPANRRRSQTDRGGAQSAKPQTRGNTIARAKRAGSKRGTGKHAAPYRSRRYRGGNAKAGETTAKGDCYDSTSTGC